MFGFYELGCNHSDTILDSYSATEVCTSCGLVLNDALTYTDLHPNHGSMKEMMHSIYPCGTYIYGQKIKE